MQADYSDCRIRRVVVSSGVVTTVAGASLSPGHTDGRGVSARFMFPSGIAMDSSGTIAVVVSERR